MPWQTKDRYVYGNEEYFLRHGGHYYHEASPPNSLMYAASPPSIDTTMPFVAPELAEDTLMDVSIQVFLLSAEFNWFEHLLRNIRYMTTY